MRVSTADSTACISAAEHVQTTGCLCTWSCSATYCNTWKRRSAVKKRKEIGIKKKNNPPNPPKVITESCRPYLPLPVCAVDQNEALWERRVRQQNLVKLIVHCFPQNLHTHTHTYTEYINLPTATHLLFRWLITTYIIHFWAPGRSYIIRIHAFLYFKKTRGSQADGEQRQNFFGHMLIPLWETTTIRRFIFVCTVETMMLKSWKEPNRNEIL